MATTLAWHVHAVFEELARKATSSTEQQQISLITIWHRTLTGQDADSPGFLDRFALVASAVARLELQIQNSNMPAHAQVVAQRCVDGLKQCLDLGQMHQPANRFLKQLDVERLGQLQLCEATLAAENPEILLTDDQLKEIDHQVDELIAAINAADIPACLKQLLLRQLAMMKWALENFKFVGARAVCDIAMQTVILADRVTDHRSGSTVDMKARASMRERLVSFGQFVYRLVRGAEAVDQGWQSLEKMSGDAHQIIGLIGRHLSG